MMSRDMGHRKSCGKFIKVSHGQNGSTTDRYCKAARNLKPRFCDSVDVITDRHTSGGSTELSDSSIRGSVIAKYVGPVLIKLLIIQRRLARGGR